MKFLSLFAGIGGFDLGLEWAGMECVGQVEIKKDRREVLERHWPNVPKAADIRSVKGDEFGAVDLICGGVPCQPASTAGNRRGTKDDRWLWPEALRILGALRPAWAVFENPIGILSLENGIPLEQMFTRMEALGYTPWPFDIPACAVDAWHQRRRIWIIGHLDEKRWRKQKDVSIRQKRQDKAAAKPARDGAALSNAPKTRREISERVPVPKEPPRPEPAAALHDESTQVHNWPPEPGVGMLVYGVRRGLDEVGALGDAVVPQVVEQIGKAIMEVEAA